jgi:hypothetical protein
MKNIAKLFIGTNKILFGDKRDIIRKKLDENCREIKRNEYAENTSDYFENLGFFVEYSKENICEAIEFTNQTSLYLDNQNLFLLKESAIRKKYDKISKKFEIEDEIGVTYYDVGFGFTVTFGTELLESIILFSKEYW